MYKVRKDQPLDRDRKKIAKAVRSAIRLHFSMAADDYINEVLPRILEQHELAVERGEEFVLRLEDLPQLTDGR